MTDEKLPPVSPDDLLRRKHAMEQQYKRDRLLIFEQKGVKGGHDIDAGAMLKRPQYQKLVDAAFAKQVAAFYGFRDKGL